MATQNPTKPSGDSLPDATYDVRPPRLPRPPFWMIALFLIATVATWVPLVLSARSRVTRSELPRVQFVQDMGTQPKYREQQTSDVFADGRADRPRIAGTVARGQLHEDEAYELGFTLKSAENGKPVATFVEGFPDHVKAGFNEAFVKRGQERFNIYCSVCHGIDGRGNGPVAQRALELGSPINPANLTEAQFRERPNGHIFNTINVGIRSMPSYGSQISVDDRWAIVAYVRALQLSQNAPADLVPGDQRATLPEPKVDVPH